MDNLQNKEMCPVDEASGEKSHISWVILSDLEAQKSFGNNKTWDLGPLKAIPDPERSASRWPAQEQSGCTFISLRREPKPGIRAKAPDGRTLGPPVQPCCWTVGPRSRCLPPPPSPYLWKGNNDTGLSLLGLHSFPDQRLEKPIRKVLGKSRGLFVLISLIFYLTLIRKAPGDSSSINSHTQQFINWDLFFNRKIAHDGL